MNKKLLAAAIAAGLALPAMANAAPTLYGILQAEIANIDNGGTPDPDAVNVVDDFKTGRLGVKGDEDLGGGLSAIYMFEWQVDTSDGDVADGTRESWVGLKGGWGALTLGANKSPYKYYGGVAYDPLVATALQARDSDGANGGGMFSAIGGTPNSFGSNGFLNNSLAYKNKFGMAELWLAYQLSESAADNIDDNYVAGLKLDFSNLEVIFAYAAYNQAAANLDGTNMKVGAKFKFGPHSIAAQYEDHSDDAATLDATAYFINGTFGFGKHNLIVSYGNTDSDANGTTAATADRTYTAVAWMYHFSKTTRTYVGYKTTDADTATGVLDQDIISAGMTIKF